MTRADLPNGLQAAQAVHAAFAFSQEHPEITRPWYDASNYLIILAVPDEAALLDLVEHAVRRDITWTAVREPDLDDATTAVAFEPNEQTRRLCSNLPLALRDPALV